MGADEISAMSPVQTSNASETSNAATSGNGHLIRFEHGKRSGDCILHVAANLEQAQITKIDLNSTSGETSLKKTSLKKTSLKTSTSGETSLKSPLKKTSLKTSISGETSLKTPISGETSISVSGETSLKTSITTLEHVTPSGNCILHVAAKSGQDQIMETVLKSLLPKLPLHTPNSKGNTALHIAASLGHRGISARLITGASGDGEAVGKQELLTAKNVEKNTALHLAVKHGHYAIVDLLINADPGLTSITNEAGESPLFLAVDRGFFGIALLILGSQNCSEHGRKQMNVLHAAVIRVEIKSQFKTIRKDWRCLNIFGSSQRNLDITSAESRIKTLEKWKKTGKLNITGADFVRMMLDKFPNAIMKADYLGWTPLHYAAYFGNFEVVKLFLENDNISLAYMRDIQGMSALHISAMEGHCDVMSAIIEKFPYICEWLDDRGRTALHLAAESGRTNAVKILLSSLDFQDLINEQENDEGNTAMHLAAIKRRYKILILLACDCRVEKRATNKEGKTVADILQLQKPPRLIKMVRQLMLMPQHRREVLLSLEREVERQTTEDQIAENEGHEQFKESHTVDFKELIEYNALVMTLVTTVTFAAAFQVPGGNDNNGRAVLVENKHFKNFLIFDTLSFGFSAATLLIYFGMPIIQKMTRVQKYIAVHTVAMWFSMISLFFMHLAFMEGVAAVLEEKSSHYIIIIFTINFGWYFPIFLFAIISYKLFSSFRSRNKIRLFISG